MRCLKDKGLIKKVLQEVLKEKENNLVRLYFDYHYSSKKWNEGQEELNKLKDEKQRLEQERNVADITVGKTVKTKARILELERQIRDIDVKGQNIMKWKVDMLESKVVIENSKVMLEELENCIIKPEEVFNIYESNKPGETKEN